MYGNIYPGQNVPRYKVTRSVTKALGPLQSPRSVTKALGLLPSPLSVTKSHGHENAALPCQTLNGTARNLRKV